MAKYILAVHQASSSGDMTYRILKDLLSTGDVNIKFTLTVNQGSDTLGFSKYTFFEHPTLLLEEDQLIKTWNDSNKIVYACLVAQECVDKEIIDIFYINQCSFANKQFNCQFLLHKLNYDSKDLLEFRDMLDYSVSNFYKPRLNGLASLIEYGVHYSTNDSKVIKWNDSNKDLNTFNKNILSQMIDFLELKGGV